MKVEQRLEELSITLPAPPSALGAYVGAVTTGNLVFVSGHGTAKPDGTYLTGKVPTECSEEEAYQAARLVGLNVLATLKKHLLKHLKNLKQIPLKQRLEERYNKFRDHGQFKEKSLDKAAS